MKSKSESKYKFAYRLAYRAMRAHLSGYMSDSFYAYQFRFLKDYGGVDAWLNANNSFYESNSWKEWNYE